MLGVTLYERSDPRKGFFLVLPYKRLTLSVIVDRSTPSLQEGSKVEQQVWSEILDNLHKVSSEVTKRVERKITEMENSNLKALLCLQKI